MGRVGRAAADPEDKQTPAACPRVNQQIDTFLYDVGIELLEDTADLSEIVLREAHRAPQPAI